MFQISFRRELSDLKQHNSGINIASNEKTDIVLVRFFNFILPFETYKWSDNFF